MRNWFACLVVAAALLMSYTICAQTPLLERKVSIPSNVHTVGEALKSISAQTGCVFSYAGGVIAIDQKVTLSSTPRSVRDVLTQMFGSTVQMTERKNYIVLTRTKPGQNKASGYVQSKSGQPIVNATVYDPVQLRSARTNVYGYYEIKLKTDSIPPLVVSKEHFRDTILHLPQGNAPLQYLTLEAKDTTLAANIRMWGDSAALGLRRMRYRWGDRWDSLIEVRNVRDSLHRSFQVSFVPVLGTNGRMSPLVYNTWSLNLVGGLSAGVRGAEIGGVFNLNRGDVRYFQAAGVFNLVDGRVQGAQLAGFANFVQGNVMGLQAAGFMNISKGQVSGFQAAGFMNSNAAGFRGMSAAGFLNQSSGASYGLQAAGFMNQCDTMVGVQIAGFLNKARMVKGVQIGFINVADSVQGLSIGFLSFIRSGYKELGLQYNELGYLHAQLRTGQHMFYTIIDAGVRLSPVNDKTHFSYGYGIGSSSNHRKPWIWNNDLTIHHYVPGRFVDAWQYVGRWYSGIERTFGRYWAFACGLSANVQAYQVNGDSMVFPFSDRRVVWSRTSSNGFSYRVWIGGQMGVRFRF